MPTFFEIQEQLSRKKNKLCILEHLTEYLDSEFRPMMGGDPKKFLLNEDKIKIPAHSIESVVESLLEEAQELRNSIEETLRTPVQEVTTGETNGTGSQPPAAGSANAVTSPGGPAARKGRRRQPSEPNADQAANQAGQGAGSTPPSPPQGGST